MTDIMDALADINQPLATFQALHKRVQDTIGVQLFTLTQVSQSEGLASRIYTSHPDVYPVHGQKQIEPNTWTATVLDRHETFVASTIDEFSSVFPDHALIQSLGYESCTNIPIIIGGSVIGTLNCLDVAGHYTPQQVQVSESLKTHGAIAFLVHDFQSKNRAS